MLPFVGPPFGLPLWAAFARLDYARAALLWSSLLALAFATLTAGTLRLVAPGSRPLDYLAALALGAGFGPLTSGLALGQVAVFACAAMVAAQIALARRNVFATAVAALAAALQPNLGIALAARLPERRAAFAFTLSAALALGCSTAALGAFSGIARYAGILREHARAEAGIAIQTTIDAVARGFGANGSAAASLAGLVALLAGGALLTLFASRRYAALERFALISAALPLALPFAHEHDLTPALFPALLCTLRCSGVVWVAAGCATVGIAVDWLGLAQRPAGILQSIALATLTALALAALGPRPLGRLRFVPLLVVPAVALAGSLAARHPLPIWPDALPLAFHADKLLSVAQVWRNEQVAAGLGARDPVWAGLRACSLFGCLLLTGAAALGLRGSPKPLR